MEILRRFFYAIGYFINCAGILILIAALIIRGIVILIQEIFKSITTKKNHEKLSYHKGDQHQHEYSIDNNVDNGPIGSCFEQSYGSKPGFKNGLCCYLVFYNRHHNAH